MCIRDRYRRAIEIRRSWPPTGSSTIGWDDKLDGCLLFWREDGPVLCMINTTRHAVQLPEGDVVLASGPLDGSRLPPDTAVWLQR